MARRMLELAVPAAFRICPWVQVAASRHYFRALDTALEDTNGGYTAAYDPAADNSIHIKTGCLPAGLRDGDNGSGGLQLGAVFASESVSRVGSCFGISHILSRPGHPDTSPVTA